MKKQQNKNKITKNEKRHFTEHKQTVSPKPISSSYVAMTMTWKSYVAYKMKIHNVYTSSNFFQMQFPV